MSFIAPDFWHVVTWHGRRASAMTKGVVYVMNSAGSADGTIGLHVPAGKTLKVLSFRAKAKAEATAGTYTLNAGMRSSTLNYGSLVDTLVASASGVQSSVLSISDDSGTKASPLYSLAGGSDVMVQPYLQADASSPASFSDTKAVWLTMVIE